jgi:zinc protease
MAEKGTPSSLFPLSSSRSPYWTIGVRREVLGNGLTLLVQPDRSAPVVSVVTHVKAGFFDEPDRWSGISHVLEHMFFKGTPRRGVGAIARETKGAGGYLNASTTYDHTTYFTVLPASGLETALDIQSDALRNSVIDADELARELQVIIQEAKRKLDTPSAVAYETLHEVMFDRHRIRRWRIGHEEQLARLTRDDLWAYYRSRYVPERTIV